MLKIMFQSEYCTYGKTQNVFSSFECQFFFVVWFHSLTFIVYYGFRNVITSYFVSEVEKNV